MGDFDSVKIGVCDAYWTPAGQDPATSEIFLGLTKGGCELVYTPEWYDLQVDRYGKSPTDSALVGEAIMVRIPLAETDLNKINLFAHTANKVLGFGDNYKLTFGRFPGFRLSNVAGRIRLHPVSMGANQAEDVILYKAVNKAPLQLNYKLDEERIFQTEFSGMINRDHISGALLWAIGDPDIGTTNIKLSSTLDLNGLPTNLIDMVKNADSSIWINVPETPIYSTADADLSSVDLQAYCEFNGNVYNITPLVTFSLKTGGADQGAWINGAELVDGTNLPDSAPVLPDDSVGGTSLGALVDNTFTSLEWSVINALGLYKLIGSADDYNVADKNNWSTLALGDLVNIEVVATVDTLTAEASINVQMTNIFIKISVIALFVFN